MARSCPSILRANSEHPTSNMSGLMPRLIAIRHGKKIASLFGLDDRSTLIGETEWSINGFVHRYCVLVVLTPLPAQASCLCIRQGLSNPILTCLSPIRPDVPTFPSPNAERSRLNRKPRFSSGREVRRTETLDVLSSI